jgi:hypothetical protein
VAAAEQNGPARVIDHPLSQAAERVFRRYVLKTPQLAPAPQDAAYFRQNASRIVNRAEHPAAYDCVDAAVRHWNAAGGLIAYDAYWEREAPCRADKLGV